MTEPVSTPPRSGDAAQWERDVIQRLAFAALEEQRRARRWSIFFKLLLFAYLLLALVALYRGSGAEVSISTGKHTALVDLDGVIAEHADASADRVVSGLRAAFKDKNTAGVILRINSPGGSPVQSGYINDEIKRLRAKYPDIPLYAVVTDMCASGAYYVAVAADKIYADKASMVGSIGVLMNGFGFVDAMKKVGVERRLFTAGEHKGFLDPFSPLREEDRAHVQAMLRTIHRQFIDAVRAGRGERLKENPELFSGLVWTGEESVELGLVDGLASSSTVAREVIGAERIVDFTVHGEWFERIADRIGAAMARTMLVTTIR